jgi:hypothetical protein
MISQVNGKWMAKCDRCDRSINTGQKSFQQAANYLSRAEGWDSWEHSGEWTNYCPRCIEGGDFDLDRAGIGFTKKWIADDD